MPMYEFMCYTCKKQMDRLCKYENKEAQTCPDCDSKLKPLLTAPQRTPGRWGDSGGGYDRSLGRHFNNSMEKEKYIRANGLIAASDFGGVSFVDGIVEREEAKHVQHEKDMEVFKDVVSKGGDLSRAYAETFSVDNMKARGLLDSDVNSGA
jgi:putative FmdB family regulatory protein